jgi:hypothetical protein
MKLRIYRMFDKWNVGEPGKLPPFSVQYDDWTGAVKFARLCFIKPNVWEEWSSM